MSSRIGKNFLESSDSIMIWVNSLLPREPRSQEIAFEPGKRIWYEIEGVDDRVQSRVQPEHLQEEAENLSLLDISQS